MKKLNVAIVLGAIIAIVGAALVIVYGRNVDNRIADGKATVDVLVADRTIPQGATISSISGYVHVAKIPRAYAVTNPIASTAGLSAASSASAGAVLLGPVASGTQLSYSMFGAAGTTSVLTPASGDIAVAVTSDTTTGVANYVTAGSKVDIFVTYTSDSPSSSAGGTADSTQVADVTKLFMSDVRVLSTSYAVKTSSGSATNGTSTTPTNVFVAVLDLKPTDAEKVINAQQLGKIYFALNTGSAHTTPTGANPGDVVGSNR